MVNFLIAGNCKIYYKLRNYKKLIEKSDKIIACDGAIVPCLQNSIDVDYVIGDMDSLVDLTFEDLAKFDFEVHKIEHQDSNDLSKAIAFAETNGAKRIDIIGVEGGSNQHQFAAYWCLFQCNVEAYIHLDESIVSTVKDSSVRLPIGKGKSFSIFALGTCQGISITGSKWDMDNQTLEPSSRGLHNIAASDEIIISCTKGSLLIFRSRWLI